MTIETRSCSAMTNADMNLLSASLERRFFFDYFGESYRKYLKSHDCAPLTLSTRFQRCARAVLGTLILVFGSRGEPSEVLPLKQIIILTGELLSHSGN